MAALTLKDRKLLYWLDQDSRATLKALAKKVGMSEQGVGYKLRLFERTGIIKTYVTFVNTLALGYSHYKVLLRLQDINPQKEEDIISSLQQHTHIRWVVSCGGRWDINFSILALTPSHFVSIYREIEDRYGDYIAEKNVSLLVKSPGFTKGYLIDQNSLRTLDYEDSSARKLDAIDRRMLRALSQYARKSVVTLSKEIRVTSDVIRYRLKKLENGGVISGYTIRLGLSQLNILRYSVFFSLHKMNEHVEQKMISFAKAHNHIMFVLVMIGTYDLSLELEVPSYEVLDNIVKKFREQFSDNIQDFEVIFNTHEYKYDFYPFSI